MSRSYKHTPIIKDNNHKNFYKIAANRKFRRQHHFVDEDAPVVKNNTYKKEYCRWAIHDAIWYKSYQQAIRQYEFYCTPNAYYYKWSTYEQCVQYAEEFKAEYPTLESFINKYWKKIYKRK